MAIAGKSGKLELGSGEAGLDIERLFTLAVGKIRISVSEFWQLTPYELSAIIEGYADQLTEQRQELLYLAWHVEAFSRQKRMPALKKVLKEGTQKKHQKRLSKEQLMKIAQSKGLLVPQKWR